MNGHSAASLCHAKITPGRVRRSDIDESRGNGGESAGSSAGFEFPESPSGVDAGRRTPLTGLSLAPS
jgi:hypothetical protein